MSPGERSGAPLLGRSALRGLLEAHGLHPVKALGQHFVSDPHTVERIVRLAGVSPGDRVVEIGAGLGSLTLALHAAGAKVTAIEIDRRLAAVLRETLPGDVRIVEGDALECDWATLLDEGRWLLVANLPYNVGTHIVLDVLERAQRVDRLLVMVQQEVGERLAAKPGGREYGAVSVRVAYFATARIVGKVAAEVFLPQPNVASALVLLERRPAPAVDPSEATYEEIGVLVRAGFAGRRKMLRRSLAGLVDERTFACAGVAPTARAEELAVEEWGKLAGCRRSAER